MFPALLSSYLHFVGLSSSFGVPAKYLIPLRSSTPLCGAYYSLMLN
jgi:hypothetical protein